MGGFVIEVTSEEEFRKHIQNGSKPVLVDFTATWCGPCRAMAPKFEELSSTYRSITFLKVDVDQQKSISQAAGITAMPTFQLYVGGQKKEEVRGANLPALQQWLEKYHNPFQGRGRTLSSMANGAPANTVPSPIAANSAPPPQIDTSKPTTSVQIRLLDGSRLTARFNTSHTVADLRRYISGSSPGGPATFQLISGFPPKPVGEDSLTLEQAGLINAAVIQK